VRDVHRGNADLALDAFDLDPHLFAQLEIEVGKRLIEQQELGTEHDRAGERGTLLLAAGKMRCGLVRHLREPNEPQDARYTLFDLGFVDLANFQRVGHVLGHRHVRPDRVALEDHSDIAFFGRDENAGRG
jgi:hypothetical protein